MKEQDKIQDGFDAIEYPCVFSFKAMCKVQAGLNVVQCLVELVDDTLAKGAPMDSCISHTKTKKSRNKNFMSVTLATKIDNRKELECVYHALSQSPYVLMTL